MFPPLRYACYTVGTLEVPDEISLVYTVTGCPLRCPGCHSADLRDGALGAMLDRAVFLSVLDRYRELATCVCFLGGEWQPASLTGFLACARSNGYATCLYTGLDSIDDSIAVHLDYLKTGPFVSALGGLDSPSTNQRFLDLRTGRDLTHRFRSPLANPSKLREAA